MLRCTTSPLAMFAVLPAHRTRVRLRGLLACALPGGRLVTTRLKWYAGSDHAGLVLKNELVALLRARGCEVIDLGTTTTDSVDYPDFGKAVAERVVAEDALGLLVCGTGNGIMMSANKVRGARAALATESFTARMARLHNDANIIAFGARVVGAGVASDALIAFWEAEFEGGRHQRRVDKMMAIE